MSTACGLVKEKDSVIHLNNWMPTFSVFKKPKCNKDS